MPYYIGLMSGTSLDGVDGVLVEAVDTLSPASSSFSLQKNPPARQLAASYVPFSPALRAAFLDLQQSGLDEIHRASMAANQLAIVYAEAVQTLLQDACLSAEHIRAIGAHGQTVRHRPELGYTTQINNPALLAERVNIDVIADFRSRDIAAGGQGAPLVPAYHRSVFGKLGETRVVANIGGMSNISILYGDGKTTGFDTGPGNVLMDLWCMQHTRMPYDKNGAWAKTGQCNVALLAALLDEPFLKLAPPKSTGRDLFHDAWLHQKIQNFSMLSAADIQATLCAFTAQTIVDAILTYAPDVRDVYVCGGGAFNATLMDMMSVKLSAKSSGNALMNLQSTALQSTALQSTAALGVSPNHVEALAFAWLAQQYCCRQAGNLAQVTGAQGERILGACYPR